MPHSPKRILILTKPRDIHAYAVAEVLRHKGAEVSIWHTSDFPTLSTESILFEQGTVQIRAEGPDLALEGPDPTAVWNRRISMKVDSGVFDKGDLEFAASECVEFRGGLFDLLAPEAFWVNPWRSALQAERKIVQHQAAIRSDLETPDTLYTNDPDQIRDFLARHDGRIIYKAFRSRPWSDGTSVWVPYTSLLRERDLPEDEVLQATPGIYQALLEKQYELRVTVIGQRVFAAKLCSQDTPQGQLDWKKGYEDLEIEPWSLSPEVSEACLTLLGRLGLVFGCIDLVVTPEGRHVFLEINQMGQFLFVELHSGFPLLDALSELLLQGKADFDWDPDAPEFLFTAEMEESIRSVSRETKRRHVDVPTRVWSE